MTFITTLKPRVDCVHIMKVYRGSGDLASLILRNVAKRRREENFTDGLLYFK